MNFRQFLESDEKQPSMYSFSKARGLVPNGYAVVGAGEFSILISQKEVDVEPGTAYSPLMRQALEALAKVRPDLHNHVVTFDGHKVAPLGQLVGQPHQEFPTFLYHGTSSVVWDDAQKNGLRPRNLTGVNPVFGAHAQIKASNDKIYLASDDGNDVKFAAREAASKRNFGGEPVVLKVRFDQLNFSKLRPDEDSKKATWEESLHDSGTVAYEGSINPGLISLHMIRDKETNGWVRV